MKSSRILRYKPKGGRSCDLLFFVTGNAIILYLGNVLVQLKKTKVMLSEKLLKALNSQVNAEIWSAYLYLSMSLDANARGDKGIANWYFVQYQEEIAHSRIFMNYILSRGARVELEPVAEVKTRWASAKESFGDTLEHERKVTAMIDALYRLANAENDFATSNMLNWFVGEQVEEEENVNDILSSLDKIGDSKYGLYMIDKELGARTYVEPSPLSGK